MSTCSRRKQVCTWAAALALPLALVVLACAKRPLALTPLGSPASGRDADAVPTPVAIYDSNPQHLWNRLHAALFVRAAPDGTTYGQDRVDPLLWATSTYLLTGRRHQQVLTLLDEFNRRPLQISDPVKRAVLQHDLWSVFDWAAEDEEANSWHVPVYATQRHALSSRLAAAIRKLALTREQIAHLPNNYLAAAQAATFAATYDAQAGAFFPRDLLAADSHWIAPRSVKDGGWAPVALQHSASFQGRSAFTVFIQLPGGPQPTADFLARIHQAPTPPGPENEWLVPSLPAGTRLALLRQMMLIDSNGQVAESPITEVLQVRVMRKSAAQRLDFGPNSPPVPPDQQSAYEFRLQRAKLFAGAAGGLISVDKNQKDFISQFRAFPFDPLQAGASPGVPGATFHPEPVMASCIACHERAPFASGGEGPLGENAPEGQRLAARYLKQRRFEYGLLLGYLQAQQDPPLR